MELYQLLSAIEILGYCPISNKNHILPDILIPQNFPFTCPIDRDETTNGIEFLNQKAQWLFHCLSQRIAFEIPKTPTNLASLIIYCSPEGTTTTGIYLGDFDLKGYEKPKDGLILFTLKTSDWLRLGGGNWYQNGGFYAEKIPNAIYAHMRQEPNLTEWEPYDLVNYA